MAALTLGDQLRQWREAAGLTQPQLADILGITQQSVSDYERNRSAPDRRRADAYANAVGVDLATFLRALARIQSTPDVETTVDYNDRIARLNKRDKAIVDNLLADFLGEG